FLWTVNPGAWPPAGVSPASPAWGLAAAASYLASSLVLVVAGRVLSSPDGLARGSMSLALLAGIALMAGGLTLELYGHWQSGLGPTEHAYGATVYAFAALQGQFVGAVAVMGGFTLARVVSGKLDNVRRSTFDNTNLL